MGNCITEERQPYIYNDIKVLTSCKSEIDRLFIENKWEVYSNDFYNFIIDNSFYFIMKTKTHVDAFIMTMETGLLNINTTEKLYTEFIKSHHSGIEKTAYIPLLIVDKEKQRQGLATTLLTLTFDKLRSKGIKYVCLHTNTTNNGAIK